MNKVYKNNITKFLDNYLNDSCEDEYYILKNHILFYGNATDNNNISIYVIRRFGATRGQIFVNKKNNVIVHIEIYNLNNVYCYTVPFDILSRILQERFIGAKMELEKIKLAR
ncbi:hypothetical protein CWE04_11240 [Thomasclavelia cocleata]|uniref:Uncharacterized protein n=1 Tax=Thomasclavelia cocleata TaxID=69824 RepID=A0A1I0BGL5_9FIRM|nr:hypothetical protein [Thomasclavelia cocleata]MCR1959898.1 hypothetical protein [Thomasclavelia cocleata]NDO41756.1 hypothetical protein [Thomasclavelia cocleata]PJN79783.1 hypothetical protein CWE04_11240 [Thomasclavelia cocleata]SET05335.1 hypothetical protein SAMN04489758_10194 [Thomasclavelia cocleata]